MFQTYSDDINITVPPISSHILQRKFDALLENGAHFVNIVDYGAQNYVCRHPVWRLF